MNGKYEIVIRSAKKEDMKIVADMVQELADFLNLPKEPRTFAKELERDGFESQAAAFRCKVAEVVNTDTRLLVGYVLYTSTYSMRGGRALTLEELYVLPSQRRRGVGKMLFDAVAKEASSTGCFRLDFHVLEWNPVCSFYESRKAVNLTHSEQMLFYSIFGDELQAKKVKQSDMN